MRCDVMSSLPMLSRILGLEMVVVELGWWGWFYGLLSGLMSVFRDFMFIKYMGISPTIEWNYDLRDRKSVV